MATNLIDKIYTEKGEPIKLVENSRLAASSELNEQAWTVAGVPLGNGNFWMYRDNNAKVSFGDNSVMLDIRPFSLNHDQVQIFDNPKMLYLTKNSFGPGRQSKIGFSCRMSGQIVNGDTADYRDGFAAFNVLDFSTGMVFDMVTNGHKIWAIYERLFMPGVTTPEQAFTNMIRIDKPTSSDNELECAIEYDRAGDTAKYYLNRQLVYQADDLPVKIDSLHTGFGIITLHPIENGRSVSCKGQGGIGSWSDFRWSKE